MGAFSAKYRLGDRIGGGGMAEVFEATLVGAEGFSRPIAIKRMLTPLSSDPAFGEMFVNEARIAALLHHDNIAGVLDFDRDDDGRYFIAMELIQGVDLRTLERSGLLPFDVVAQVIADVLRGLDYAHELVHDGKHLGIVHRDISPHNVMISWSGAVKIVDFGIAKAVAATGISRSGQLKGKVGYMSPEQAHGHQLDGRSDLFAVGVMLHELLTGGRLFDGSTEPEVLARLLTQPIPDPRQHRPEAPADLSAVALQLLQRDRTMRYGSAREALEAILSGSSMSARGELSLRSQLEQRFPDRVVARASTSGTPLAATAAASPRAVHRADAEARGDAMTMAAAPQATLTASPSGGTPTAAGQPAAPTVVRSSRSTWYVAAAALVAIAAVASIVAAVSSGQPAAEAPADAGLEAVAANTGTTPEALDAENPPDASIAAADAAQAVAVASPDAAPTAVATVKHKRPVHKRPVHKPPVHKPPDAKPAPPGDLRIVVMPWAKITVDGKAQGQTPKTLALPAGEHTVVLSNPELGKKETVRVTVRARRLETVKRDWR